MFKMYIRSQNKENIVEINGMIGLKYNDKKSIIANYQPDFTDKYDGYYEILGTYKSKERAIEVLDEIQKHIENNLLFNFKSNGECEILPRNEIYQMPKE